MDIMKVISWKHCLQAQGRTHNGDIMNMDVTKTNDSVFRLAYGNTVSI